MLTVNNLSLVSGQKTLVNNVSFNLNKGESLALMGASGAGKSLISLACMDLLPPNIKKTQGEIAFGVARPALIMQNPADCFDPLFRVRTVFEETIFRKLKHLTIDDTQAFLDLLLVKVGFYRTKEILDSYPFELSGGMLHRLMLALALGSVIVNKTMCVIADEPLAGLDTPSKVLLLKTIKKVQQEYGFALLYIDHDLNAAHAVAQRLAIMDSGSIVEEGEFSQVVQHSQHQATRNLVQAFTRISTVQVKPPMQHMDESILSIKNVSKLYDGNVAVHNVSVNVHKGQSLGLVGANGAGKSTLIRLILGLEDADAGEVLCMGYKVHKTFKNVPWRKDLQAMFQHGRLAVNPRMQAKDIILEPLQAQGLCTSSQEQENKVRELLELVELPRVFAKKYPMNMSGGQLQRLCLARTLALNPQIVLLDEPLADLDAAVAERLQIKLQELQSCLSLSYVYISHDIGSVLRMCDTVCVLEAGQVVDTFASENYLSEERHRAFKELYAASFVGGAFTV